MPEIAAVGAVGALITFILVNLNLYWVHKSFQKSEFLTLNKNLLKVLKYWSIDQGALVDLKSADEQKALKLQDYKKSTRSAFIFGTILIFLSWIGLIFFGIYYLSVNVLAKTRLEKRIFDSELVSADLGSEKVQGLLAEMQT